MTFGIIVLSTIISVTATTMDAPYEVGTYWGTSLAFFVMALIALLALVLTRFINEKRA
ncbi:hypothetical protein JCM19037_2732 [Geomicrobium sp. JCM 19037]|uniref:hypothetical protein n=1 Tax=Geomicrobium sp. JCM 19037 TaxID=1460634 RepID=UPI00045F4941|nr:hypothetical protein [Geomicrobium sp. JCM 19037]GAK04337.1 hypothetical protein JCM19037_2732 [Geomicrobium sp. JCM 19037]